MKAGYDLRGTKLDHLLYMDDLKVIAKSETELEEQLTTVRRFSDDIQMEFGTDKCATAVFKRGRLQTRCNIREVDLDFRQIEGRETYRYLGVEEGEGIDHHKAKEQLRKEYRKRVRKILSTELNGKNKIVAIGQFALPLLQYSFGVVDWRREEIKALDRGTRKLLTAHNMHHPRADIDRVYVSRREGGRGLQQIEAAYKTAILNIGNYLSTTEQRFVNLMKGYDINLPKSRSIIRESEDLLGSLSFQGDPAESPDRTKNKIKSILAGELKRRWRDKAMHGQYLRQNEENPNISKEATFGWLTRSSLKGETESLIIAAQDQAINTRYFSRHILKKPIDSNCRVCGCHEETVSHIVSSCPILAKHEYIRRHDNVARLIHFKICQDLGVEVGKKWYEHIPEPVVNSQNVTVLWDQQIHTDRTITANKPDIVIKDRRNNMCTMVDVAVPADANVMAKEAEKLLKYRDLAIEISRMWNIKTRIVPIVIGATGNITNRLQSNLCSITGRHDMTQLQTTAIMGTAHIIRKVMG